MKNIASLALVVWCVLMLFALFAVILGYAIRVYQSRKGDFNVQFKKKMKTYKKQFKV
jgi:beta-lactamase regulating signal transducer with metallopeptidase domain